MKMILISFFLISFSEVCCLNENKKSKVYFTRDLSSESIVKMFKKVGKELKGKIALKVHSGEQNGPYFLKPDYLQKIHDETGGTFVECNTAYERFRHNTTIHKKTIELNGWLSNDRRFSLMDEDPDKDWELEIPDGQEIKKNIVGEHLKDYDSCLVLAHFKGHGGGGFGGALKQLSIGFGSQQGKTYIHTAGLITDWTEMKNNRAPQQNFTTAMADAATSIVRYFNEKNKGGLVYINVMKDISKSCDCAGDLAPKPKIKDIGILASDDPVAIDRAGVDLIRKSEDCEGKTEWIEQIERLLGENTIVQAEKMGIGSQDYELIEVDKEDKKDSASTIKYLFSTLLIFVMILL